MSLTQEDLKALRATFRMGDHEFRQEYVYITEEAICDRLEDVDPSWSFDIVEMTTRDNQAVVTMRMTIKGVTRVGVGMQTIQSAGEAEKGAATDALKRCARLFGVGRYLLGAPEKAKFQAWLAQKQKELDVGGVDISTGEVAPAPMLTTPLQAGGQWTKTHEATSPKAMREREAAKEVENKSEATEDEPPPADEFDDIALSTRTPVQSEIGLVEPPKHPKNTRTWDIGRVKTHAIQDRKHIPVKGATPHFDALIAKLESSLRITDTSATEEVCAAIDAYYAEKLKATG